MAKHRDNVIYINGRFLTHSTTGVVRYSREVVTAIDRFLERGDCVPMLRDAEWNLLAPPGTECDLKLRRIRFREIGLGGGHLWEQLHLLRHSAYGRLLSPANSGPIGHPRQIVVIHDAAIFNAPAGYGRSYRMYHKLLEGLLARSARIATVSQFSRRELASCLGIPSEDILLAPDGTDHFRSVVPDPTIVDRLKLEAGKYFVTLGLSTANKNIPLAIEAYRSLNRQEIKLVVVGESSRASGAQNLKAYGGVILAGRVTDKEVAGLLRSATALLFPSRYEGFGIPSLEAMLQGCPVIASTAPAIMEVCGDAALHFHPDDAMTLRDLMQRVLDNPEVAGEMRIKGRCRPDIYQWDATAAALIRGLQDMESAAASSRVAVARHIYQTCLPGQGPRAAPRRSSSAEQCGSAGCGR
jgi:glycosyltransferase involved in cell wall biosynthesis